MKLTVAASNSASHNFQAFISGGAAACVKRLARHRGWFGITKLNQT